MICNDWAARAFGEKGNGVVKSAFFASLLAAGSAAAQEANELFLDATYLGAPTEWCIATAGVPMTVKMDGPNIIKGPDEFPRTVRERRGSSVRVINGANTASFHHTEDLAGPNAEVSGRFSAEFRTCFSPWSAAIATGTWRLSGNDGSDMDSGSFENETLFLPIYFPFFRPVSGTSNAHFAQFGDRLLYTASEPRVTTTQTFLAEPDKE
jgi:hypothetical protein